MKGSKPLPETLIAQAMGEVDSATGALTPPISVSTNFEQAADGSYHQGRVYSRADNPTYSVLELADGWLSVGELSELSNGQALICLSACHTGMSGVGPGDELLGLTRAVLGAGAQALVASLWAANDDTAACGRG